MDFQGTLYDHATRDTFMLQKYEDGGCANF